MDLKEQLYLEPLRPPHAFKLLEGQQRYLPYLYTEQMHAEGLGRKLLLTLVTPAEPLKSRPWVL